MTRGKASLCAERPSATRRHVRTRMLPTYVVEHGISHAIRREWEAGKRGLYAQSSTKGWSSCFAS